MGSGFSSYPFILFTVERFTNERSYGEIFDFLPFPFFPFVPRIKTFPFRWEVSPRVREHRVPRKIVLLLSLSLSPPVLGDSSYSRTGFCACKYDAVARASWLSRQYSTRSQGEKRTLGFYSRKNGGKTEPKPF